MVQIVSDGLLSVVQDFFRKVYINQYELLRTSSISIASKDHDVVVIRFALAAIYAVASTDRWMGDPPPNDDRFTAALKSLLNCSTRSVRIGGEVMRGYEVPAHMLYRLVGVDFLNHDGREPAMVSATHDLSDVIK